jgi:23S rRNA pseudouridine2605 synthase
MQDMAQSGGEKEGERIAKVIARAGLCSRREAEAWIAAGRVAVNGDVIASPALNVGAQDRIAVDGKPLPARERTRLFLYHKPAGLVTTHADPQGRPTIFAALPRGLPRLISVGRLDLNTEGLLLLTNDGGLARALELPATGWLRRYRVRAHGRVSQDALDRLRGGIAIDGIRYGAIEATLDRAQGSNIWLTFAIREGKNREVKNVLGHLGLKVNRLIRVSFGPFQLGDLAEGAIEEIGTRTLREQLGERLAVLAGADFSAPMSESAPAHAPSPHSAERAQRAAKAVARSDKRAAAYPPPASVSERWGGLQAKRAGWGAVGPAKERAPHPRPLATASLRSAGGGEPASPLSERGGQSRQAKAGSSERIAARKSRRDAERLGEPEVARREKRHGRKPHPGKRR